MPAGLLLLLLSLCARAARDLATAPPNADRRIPKGADRGDELVRRLGLACAK